VADDVEVNRMVAHALLQAEGADVVCVDDGDEAVLALQQQPFDLVLLDNRMPRMSGIDAARAIRRLEGPAGRTRLVALTASASDEDRAAFRLAGMQDVLLKPVRGRDLRAALHAV
jgi:CheY-like chemotaxis protein